MRKVLNRLPVIFIIIWKYIHHRKKDFETLCLTMTAENTFTNSKLVLLLTDFFLIKILRFVFLFWGFCLFACLILVVVFLVLFYLEFFPCFFSFYLFACLGSFLGGVGVGVGGQLRVVSAVFFFNYDSLLPFVVLTHVAHFHSSVYYLLVSRTLCNHNVIKFSIEFPCSPND